MWMVVVAYITKSFLSINHRRRTQHFNNNLRMRALQKPERRIALKSYPEEVIYPIHRNKIVATRRSQLDC